MTTASSRQWQRHSRNRDMHGLNLSQGPGGGIIIGARRTLRKRTELINCTEIECPSCGGNVREHQTHDYRENDTNEKTLRPQNLMKNDEDRERRSHRAKLHLGKCLRWVNLFNAQGSHQEEHHEEGTRVEHHELSLHQALVFCCFLRKQRSEPFLDLQSSSRPMTTIADQSQDHDVVMFACNSESTFLNIPSVKNFHSRVIIEALRRHEKIHEKC